MLDEGLITSGTGQEVRFKDAIIIMISNIGTSEAQQAFVTKWIGFEEGEKEKDYNAFQAQFMKKAIEKRFTPDFRNRLTATVVFDSLTPEASKERG